MNVVQTARHTCSTWIDVINYNKALCAYKASRLLHFLILHPFSGLCTGFRLTNASNIKPFTNNQPKLATLHNLISVQSTCRIRSPCVVTFTWSSASSSLQITNHSFRYASLSVESTFYRAMHFNAKRGIAIACRLSVRLSLRLWRWWIVIT